VLHKTILSPSHSTKKIPCNPPKERDTSKANPTLRTITQILGKTRKTQPRPEDGKKEKAINSLGKA
jgi:hypothetical protein